MIRQPVIILGAPRSGTTILYRCLALHPELWHLTSEAHGVLEGPFHPAHVGYESNRVEAERVDPVLAASLRAEFRARSINLNRVIGDPSRLMEGRSLLGRVLHKLLLQCLGATSRLGKPEAIRLCEKTPKNTLRVPMLEVLFPDALYVWLTRDARSNISSLLNGWRAFDRMGLWKRDRFASAGYPIADRLRLVDYQGKWWKFALVPGWQSLRGRTLADVAAWQYTQCNWYALSDLRKVPRDRVFAIRYEDFVLNPGEWLERICSWADLTPDPVVMAFARRLPRVNTSGRRMNRIEASNQTKEVDEAIDWMRGHDRFREVQAVTAGVGSSSLPFFPAAGAMERR